MQSSYAGEEDDHLGASPTSRELLVANEPHSGISALSSLVSSRWEVIRAPICLPDHGVLQKPPLVLQTTSMQSDLELLQFGQHWHFQDSWKPEVALKHLRDAPNKHLAQKPALCLMQAGKGLSNTICAEQ